jgi:hypothetical protein
MQRSRLEKSLEEAEGSLREMRQVCLSFPLTFLPPALQLFCCQSGLFPLAYGHVLAMLRSRNQYCVCWNS